MPIGLEISESRAIAVVVGDGGEVRARAEAKAGGDSVAAARTALDQLKSAGHEIADIALTSASPEAPAIVTAAATLESDGVCSPGAPLVPAGAAAAVAENWVGAGRGVRELALFAAAEHVSAGIVRGGVPVTGSRGRAASIAWLALNPVEREDYRKIGCLEAEAAAAGIVRRLVWRIKAGDHSRVQDAVGRDLNAISLDEVLAAARQGDGVSISVLRDTAKYLGMAAANLVAIADPETLVLGGVMASAADLFLEPVRIELARRLPKLMMDALLVVPATLGGDAPAIGAVRLATAAVR